MPGAGRPDRAQGRDLLGEALDEEAGDGGGQQVLGREALVEADR